MTAATQSDIRAVTIELEITIDASPARVWTAITEQANAWWIPDFHMAGEDSVVTFDASAGGQLVERHPDGTSLLWFTVLMCAPASRTLHMSGHMAPEWGGPATSLLKFVVVERPNGCALMVTDARFGHIDDETLGHVEAGWRQLFTEGLKALAEQDA